MLLETPWQESWARLGIDSVLLLALTSLLFKCKWALSASLWAKHIACVKPELGMLQHTKCRLGFHFPTTSAVLSGALCALSSADLGVLRQQREFVQRVQGPIYSPKYSSIWPWSSYLELPPKPGHCKIGIPHQIPLSKGPHKVQQAPQRVLAAPSALLAVSVPLSLRLTYVFSCSDTYVHSPSSWLLLFPPKYIPCGDLAWCLVLFSHLLPHSVSWPLFVQYYIQFPVLAFPSFRSFWSWLVFLWYLDLESFFPRSPSN